MDKTNAEYLEFAKTLAAEASIIMKKYFRLNSLSTDWKHDNSPVTVADLKINKLVIERVKKTYPEHGVLGEEDSFHPDREIVWVVDPIDGTAPFDIGMPASTFCLALVKNGVVEVSVVLDPFLNRLFWAVKGYGTYLNDQRITLKEADQLAQTYAFVSTGTQEDRFIYLSVQKALLKKGVKFITIPSFTFMALFLLEGKMCIALLPNEAPWDAAAISLIIQEAGGVVSDALGKERKYNQAGRGLLLTTSRVVHEQMIELIAKAENRAGD